MAMSRVWNKEVMGKKEIQGKEKSGIRLDEANRLRTRGQRERR